MAGTKGKGVNEAPVYDERNGFVGQVETRVMITQVRFQAFPGSSRWFPVDFEVILG